MENKMEIKLAEKKDVPEILEIIKNRCDWFEKNHIEQWGSWYYEDLYDEKYFLEAMKKYSLYIVKNQNEIIGAFLLKYENEKYWRDKEKAVYLDHFVTKVGNKGVGEIILNFIQELAQERGLKYLRLECMRINPKINEYYKNHGFQAKGEGDEPYEYRLWEKEIIKMKNLEKILEFYRETSSYTDLGFYKNFAKNLPNEIKELCLLQRHRIIHPVNLKDETRYNKNSFYGDMTKIPETRLIFEDDIFPTAQSMLAELLRKDSKYEIKREIQNKIHTTCRSQAILLAAILKAKGIPARARSGFAGYCANDGIYWDHWITEFYDESARKWILADADCCCDDIDFNPFDMPREKFLFGAKAWLGMRRKEFKEEQICYASDPVTIGLKAAIRGLFYDFHCLMNDEIIFLHMPSYIREKNFELSEEEYQELDELAELMLNPNENFEKLQEIWKTKIKFRIMSGALN